MKANKMKKYIIFLFSLFLSTHGVILCANKRGADPGILVYIDVFSGNPGPQFTITDAKTVKQIRDLIRAMPKHPSKNSGSVMGSAPGYKGMGVIDQAVKAEIRVVNIFHSDVEAHREIMSNTPNSANDFRYDEGAKLESLLLDYAVKNGIIDKELVKGIKETPEAK
jgi:hypothetical protein